MAVRGSDHAAQRPRVVRRHRARVGAAARAKLVAQVAAAAAVALLLGVLGWRLASLERGKDLSGAVAAGRRPVAPDFELKRLNGDGTLRLSSLRGRVVVLNFWASWCIPCKSEAPLLEAAWQRYRRQGLVVLGVDAQDFKSDARHFIRRYGLTYPSVADGSGSTLDRYGVSGFPETWFIDRRGRLVAEHVNGPLTAERLTRDIALAQRQ